MDLETTIELAHESGPRTMQIISEHEDKLREIYEYFKLVRVEHTIGFKLMQDAESVSRPAPNTQPQ